MSIVICLCIGYIICSFGVLAFTPVDNNKVSSDNNKLFTLSALFWPFVLIGYIFKYFKRVIKNEKSLS